MAPPVDDRNFRLPATVRPRRYAAELTLHLDADRFEGTQDLELTLQAPTDTVVLHGIDLELHDVSFRAAAGKGAPLPPASVDVRPVSETLVLRFPTALPAGEGTLRLSWRGKLSGGLRGLYRASPTIVSTQFEAADARRLFPCFDEPAFKARWALALRVPPGVVALANGRLVSEAEEAGGGGWRRLVFEETEVLSSYLVALCVGDLEAPPEQRTSTGTPVRTWAAKGKGGLTRFGQDVALAVLPLLQDYFGLPYAYGKVDQVAVPDFEAGAMENAGLITYREVALLLEPATTPLVVQKRVANIITHELAHQWFGNWVTMVWWDDLWLNEAFATWMAFKVCAQWRPEWRVWLDFGQGTAVALHLDALASTHPIRGDVNNAHEAGEAFDAITYEKGGAVLRMIEGYLGEDAFREGIRSYMRKHARANAVADDLWAALAEASRQPVLELANAWIRQGGYPLVTVEAKGERTLAVRQERFFSEPGATGPERWPVPLVLRYADAAGEHTHRVLLREGSLDVPLPEGAGPLRWVCANAGSTGFYRVAYAGELMARLADARDALEPAERISLLADAWALARAGRAPLSAFLDLAARFGGETDEAVLDELVGRLGAVEARLTEGADTERWRRWVERLLGGQLAQVGWEPRPGEDDRERLRRGALVRAVGGVARAPAAQAEARARVTRLLTGDAAALEPNLLDAAVGMAARGGDAALFDTLLAKLSLGGLDPVTQRRYLLALTAFEDAALVKRAQDALFTPTVPMQDVAFFLHGLLGNREGQASAWALVRQRWDDVLHRTGAAPMLVRRVVEGLGALKDRQQLDEARAFLEAHPVEAAPMATRQTLERLSQDVAFRERALPEVRRWLDAQGA